MLYQTSHKRRGLLPLFEGPGVTDTSVSAGCPWHFAESLCRQVARSTASIWSARSARSMILQPASNTIDRRVLLRFSVAEAGRTRKIGAGEALRVRKEESGCGAAPGSAYV